MHLQAIKLAGFKSFVDPTTVSFPSNLCAVVGPNGCGKSNIIDAVRWVMGESSVKTLRGESMADVIFNGSNTRQPVGQASIELMFDNSEGRLAGEYAAYSEISIKRQVIRDGQSNYYLNNQKCRRKDITDIFLGTGLGPRSYSIIEQGMISDLIEAKPEELRTYIEEAAGISKYRERRKETEQRISHTKDNLDRLHDLREELGRQLQHLERQADAAERYKALKAEERMMAAQLQGLKWQTITQTAEHQKNHINQLQVEHEARVSDQFRLDAEIEQGRDHQVELNNHCNEVQKRYYGYGTEIARIEDKIQHQRQRNLELNQDLKAVSENWSQICADIDNDQRQSGILRHALRQIAPEQTLVLETEAASASRLLDAEQAMQSWQQTWEAFTQQAIAVENSGQLQRAKIASIEQSIERLCTRLVSIREEIERLQQLQIEAEIPPLETMLTTQETQVKRIEQALQEFDAKIELQRGSNQEQSHLLDNQRNKLQTVRGRLASLEALQQAALGQQDHHEMAWLEGHNLAHRMRVGEQIKVKEKWAVAVETVLGDYLQAVCVEDIDAVTGLLEDLPQGSLNFYVNHGAVQHSAPFGKLGSQLVTELDLSHFLDEVFIADNLSMALEMRAELELGQSVITVQGVWLGKHWLRINKGQDVTAGILMRQTELANRQQEITTLDKKTQEMAQALQTGLTKLQLTENERHQQAKRLAECQRSSSETLALLNTKSIQAEQVQTDLTRFQNELNQNMLDLEQDRAELKTAQQQLQAAVAQMKQHTLRKRELQQTRHQKQQALNIAKEAAEKGREACHQLALKKQTLTAKVAATEQTMARLQEQQAALAVRKETLETSIAESQEPQNQLQRALEMQLTKHLAVEHELTELRQQSDLFAQQIRAREQQRAKLTETVEQVRANLDQARMEWQVLEVRRDTIKEQLAADNQELGTVLAQMSEGAIEEVWQENLTKIANKIKHLGAINLAAIDEFSVQSERKQYLDAQNEDLETALTTLENAIGKIDVETRIRFKETFDAINNKLREFFPKVFGGGYAYLEMTGENLLNTGVSVLARPPGKRNTNIRLLSGGEKALTAIALVFAIFSLNPAPFCLLDEVDAPLDDANVARYSNLVKEMAHSVQFIYITHNKIAMEMAEQLMGVTMHEPGVSRLVAVDVAEAMAAV